MRARDIPEIARLNASEKLLLVEDLWDEIASDPAQVPIPPSHLQELEKRIANHAADPDRLLTLDELQRRVDARKWTLPQSA